MSQPTADAPLASRLTPAVKWILALSVAVFFVQATLVGSSMLGWLGFRLDDLATRWWSPVTYLFVHAGSWHGFWLLAVNLYALWLFGPRLEREWSSGELVRFAVVCGLGGLALHLLLFRGTLLVGASAAVFGVMLAYARRWPDEVVHLAGVIPLRVRWLVAALAVTSLALGVDAAGGLAPLAHLGGFLTGWLHLRLATPSGGARMRPRIASLPDQPDETPRAVPRAPYRPRERGEDDVDEIVARSKAAVANNRPALPAGARAPEPDPEPEPVRGPDLDVLLDKISLHGLESLTREEREFLEHTARRLRGGDE